MAFHKFPAKIMYHIPINLSGAKASAVWKFGISTFLAFIIGMIVLPALGHFPPLFGVGETLILLFFMGIAWLWAKEHVALKGSSTTATGFRLVGYMSSFFAAWYTCGIVSTPFLKGLEGMHPSSPINVFC